MAHVASRRESLRSQQQKTHMKSAVITTARQVEIVDRPLPEVSRTQLRVRLEGCGVCASNGPVWEGRPWFDYPRQPGSPGHEGWGIVDEIGDDVVKFKRGDRVAILSYHAFAEYDVAEEDHAVPIPGELKAHACPGEPLGCAVNVFKRSDIQPDQRVAIVGIGFLGALLTQMASEAGAEVIAISRRQTALETAENCGARHCIKFDEPYDVQQQVQKISGEQLCERVIEAVGHQLALDVASELVGTRGKLAIAGFHQDGARQVNLQSWNWRGIDVINAHERDPGVYVEGMSDAFDRIVAGSLNPQPLLTHRFSLRELDEALNINTRRDPGFMKAWVSFTG